MSPVCPAWPAPLSAPPGAPPGVVGSVVGCRLGSAGAPLPGVLDQVLDRVRSWSAPDAQRGGDPLGRVGWLRGLRALVDAAEAAFTLALADVDAHGDAAVLDGAASTASWLRGVLRLAPGDAGERVRIARGARGLLQAPVAALANGELVYDQLRAVERCAGVLPADVRPAAVDLLTDLARHTDTTAVRVAGRRLRHVVDPDGALADAHAQFDRRHLMLSPLLDGMTALDGLLDPEAATVLATALAPFLVPAGPHDTRTTAQRRADGLVELATAAMADGDLPRLAGEPAHVQVLVSAQSLAGEVGAPPAVLPETPGGTGLLTPDAVTRIACGAHLTRLILDATSIPLDLGRSQRLFTPAQRRALAVRDRGCRFPRCHRPARHTDAHHLHQWDHGGPTDLANGTLLCRHHHRLVHEGGWHTQPDDPRLGANGRLWFTGPHGQQLPSDPRGP